MEADAKKLSPCDRPRCTIDVSTGPHQVCQLVIEYPTKAPEKPTLRVSEGCPNPEVALAILLAALVQAAAGKD